MNRKSLILIALGILALALYAAGLKTGTLIIFILAVIIELVFWFKYLQLKKTSTRDKNH